MLFITLLKNSFEVPTFECISHTVSRMIIIFQDGKAKFFK